MKLRLSCLGLPLVEREGLQSLRAQDASGSFGIRPGHAELLTHLEPGIVSWRFDDGRQEFCALRRGVLLVRAGSQIEIATREAVLDTDLARLTARARQALAAQDAAEAAQQRVHQQFEIQALRELLRCLRGANGHHGGPR